MNFGNLHVHSDYSYLDGFCKISDIVRRVKELGQNYVALTDHGNMCGTIEFYKECKKNGIKPIIGQEFYIVESHSKTFKRNEIYHIVLLAKNTQGYVNLIALSTKAQIEGFYYNPTIDMKLLKTYSSGLVCLTACLKGYAVRHSNDKKELEKDIEELADIFKGDLYLELQTNGQDKQIALNNSLIELSKKLKIKTVVTSDAHYINKEDYKYHDAWLCIKYDALISDIKRLRYEEQSYYLIGEDDLPEDLKKCAFNEEVADKCNLDIELGKLNFPNSKRRNPVPFLLSVCETTLETLSPFLEQDIGIYKARIDRELDVIKKLNFGHYFAVIYELVAWCKKHGIRVRARGSGAASLVCYLLGATDVDPIEYNLLFERFLHEGRISPPDLDIDVPQDKRQEILEYLKAEYGAENVSQICTLSEVHPKMAVKDAMRVMGIDYAFANAIAKDIPEGVESVEDAVEKSEKLSSAVRTNKLIKEVIELAIKFNGHIRQAGVHAAGIVISPIPLKHIVPLQNLKNNIVSQYDMRNIEELGLLKIDILGSRTLSIIDSCLVNLVEDSIIAESLHFNLKDTGTYKMLSDGETKGVFMLETPLLTKASKDFKAASINDIALIISIYRPAIMLSGMAEQCLKNSREKAIKYDHPLLEKILKDTYGTVIYQEQIMEILRELANFSWEDADEVRKILAKGAQLSDNKKQEMLAKSKEKFYTGCKKNKIADSLVNKLWKLIKDAGYCFNKAHATSYALICFQTAYLKHHYPLYFLSSVLTSVSDDTERLSEYARECKRIGIAITKPDIRKSSFGFSVDGETIRYGMAAVRGLGYKTVVEILAAMKDDKSATLEDLIKSKPMLAKKGILEALIKSGALDDYIATRKYALENLDIVLKQYRKKKKSNQIMLFGEAEVKLEKTEEFSNNKLSLMEHEVTGIFFSYDPIEVYRDRLLQLGAKSKQDVEKIRQSGTGSIAGIVTNINSYFTKTSQKEMARIMLETVFDILDLVIFPNEWAKIRGTIEIGKPIVLFVRGNEDNLIVKNARAIRG
jgi:DNA polymerase III subunit alpha